MTAADADVDALRAYAAINRLSLARRRSLAQFTCLCPEGCPLVVAYRRKRAGKKNALIVASTERSERSVFLEAPIWPPETLAIGCRHGTGDFPRTAVLAAATTDRARIRRVTDLGESRVTWKPKPVNP